MKIDKPENENYAAIVTKIRNIIPLENCDNVVATTIFGLQAIVNKETQVGDIGIFFPAEVQLSDEYCKDNNLYRHSEKNKDKDITGYIEDNRRVKAVKFRGHLSSCLFMPVESLEWTKANIAELRESDTFDTLNGKRICEKYVVRRYGRMSFQDKLAEKFKRVDAKFLPEHFATGNYFRIDRNIDPKSEVVVTQKLHGTSIRIGNTIVKRKPTLIENFLGKLGIKIKKYEYDYVYGSRKVIKDINNPNQNHFYGEDIWTREGAKLKGILPEGFVVYAELVGYTEDGAEIQKNYAYGAEPGTCEMFIYRIVTVNPQGYILDLTWNQIKDFCRNNGLNHVPEIWKGKVKKLDLNKYLEKRLFDEGFRTCLALGGDKNLVDEGVCIRLEETMSPEIYKAKSQAFLLHESKLLDEGVEDLESAQVEEEIA
jgi:hypothetical protein